MHDPRKDPQVGDRVKGRGYERLVLRREGDRVDYQVGDHVFNNIALVSWIKWCNITKAEVIETRQDSTGGEVPMTYDYKVLRGRIFTEAGQVNFLKVRDKICELLDHAGAFSMGKIIARIDGDSWFIMACVDRLVELGEIVELKRESWAQYRIFTNPKIHDHD